MHYQDERAKKFIRTVNAKKKKKSLYQSHHHELSRIHEIENFKHSREGEKKVSYKESESQSTLISKNHPQH